MDILTTELFRFTTAAGPDTVWQSLTSPALTGRWFHGLTLESSWLPGGAVEVTIKGQQKAKFQNPLVAQAIWGIWLGNSPVSSDIKTGLVGNVK